MFEDAEKTLRCVKADDRILLAVSGGADSFAMLKWFASGSKWRNRIVVAHIDHNLRENSNDVGNLVRRQADSVGVTCSVSCVDVPLALATRAESVEACARRLRYAALEQLRLKHDCHYIVTAHTLDDHAETVFMKLNQNSSWYECTGIPAARDTILRPFLSCTRKELHSLIHSTEEFDRDPMNNDFRYLRASARHRLSRAISAHPDIRSRLACHGDDVSRLNELTSRFVKLTHNKELSVAFSGVHSLVKLPKNLYLEDLDFLSIEVAWSGLSETPDSRLKAPTRRAIRDFMKAQHRSSSFPLPQSVSLHRSGESVWLERRIKTEDSHSLTRDEIVWTPGLFMNLSAGLLTFTTDTPTLSVRSWRLGERFKPAFRRTRKISDWLHDGDVHPAVRKHWPVICHNDEIIAVPGLGVSEDSKPCAGRPVTCIQWKANSLSDQQVSR